ncbi:hypothetical protein NMY22_g14308 [Coprinellus aureogranulatus]|nr:hypothetical protein NMY22_g14308 [Coprinellus aureogranulatus]
MQLIGASQKSVSTVAALLLHTPFINDLCSSALPWTVSFRPPSWVPELLDPSALIYKVIDPRDAPPKKCETSSGKPKNRPAIEAGSPTDIKSLAISWPEDVANIKRVLSALFQHLDASKLPQLRPREFVFAEGTEPFRRAIVIRETTGICTLSGGSDFLQGLNDSDCDDVMELFRANLTDILAALDFLALYSPLLLDSRARFDTVQFGNVMAANLLDRLLSYGRRLFEQEEGHPSLEMLISFALKTWTRWVHNKPLPYDTKTTPKEYSFYEPIFVALYACMDTKINREIVIRKLNILRRKELGRVVNAFTYRFVEWIAVHKPKDAATATKLDGRNLAAIVGAVVNIGYSPSFHAAVLKSNFVPLVVELGRDLCHVPSPPPWGGSLTTCITSQLFPPWHAPAWSIVRVVPQLLGAGLLRIIVEDYLTEKPAPSRPSSKSLQRSLYRLARKFGRRVRSKDKLEHATEEGGDQTALARYLAFEACLEVHEEFHLLANTRTDPHVLCECLDHYEIAGTAESPQSYQCSRCHTVTYCSEECQKSDWEMYHREEACPGYRLKRINLETYGLWLSPRERMRYLQFLEFKYFDALLKGQALAGGHQQAQGRLPVYLVNSAVLPLRFEAYSPNHVLSLKRGDAYLFSGQRFRGLVRRALELSTDDDRIRLLASTSAVGGDHWIAAMGVYRQIRREVKRDGHPNFTLLTGHVRVWGPTLPDKGVALLPDIEAGSPSHIRRLSGSWPSEAANIKRVLSALLRHLEPPKIPRLGRREFASQAAIIKETANILADMGFITGLNGTDREDVMELFRSKLADILAGLDFLARYSPLLVGHCKTVDKIQWGNVIGATLVGKLLCYGHEILEAEEDCNSLNMLISFVLKVWTRWVHNKPLPYDTNLTLKDYTFYVPIFMALHMCFEGSVNSKILMGKLDELSQKELRRVVKSFAYRFVEWAIVYKRNDDELGVEDLLNGMNIASVAITEGLERFSFSQRFHAALLKSNFVPLALELGWDLRHIPGQPPWGGSLATRITSHLFPIWDSPARSIVCVAPQLLGAGLLRNIVEDYLTEQSDPCTRWNDRDPLHDLFRIAHHPKIFNALYTALQEIRGSRLIQERLAKADGGEQAAGARFLAFEASLKVHEESHLFANAIAESRILCQCLDHYELAGTAETPKSYQCSRCHTVTYCSENCQKSDWEMYHKEEEYLGCRLERIERQMYGLWLSPRERMRYLQFLELAYLDALLKNSDEGPAGTHSPGQGLLVVHLVNTAAMPLRFRVYPTEEVLSLKRGDEYLFHKQRFRGLLGGDHWIAAMGVFRQIRREVKKDGLPNLTLLAGHVRLSDPTRPDKGMEP